MDIASNKGALNRAKAMVFAVQESAKGVVVSLAEAKKMGDEGRLKAFSGKIKGLIAKAEALSFNVEKYKMQAAKFGVNLLSIKNTYDEYNAKTGLIKAKNTAKNAELSSQEAKIRSAGAQSNAEAVKQSAAATKDTFDSQKRTIDNYKVSYENAVVSAKVAIESAWYKVQMGQEFTKNLEGRAEYAGIIEENQGAAKFFVSAAEAAARAAELTQNANIQLSEAYATAQQAAGRAAASIESGRLSGWNATASLSATGSLDSSAASSLSTSEDRSTSTTESYSQSTNAGM